MKRLADGILPVAFDFQNIRRRTGGLSELGGASFCHMLPSPISGRDDECSLNIATIRDDHLDDEYSRQNNCYYRRVDHYVHGGLYNEGYKQRDRIQDERKHGACANEDTPVLGWDAFPTQIRSQKINDHDYRQKTDEQKLALRREDCSTAPFRLRLVLP
ncbi:MAG: hypothetical protein WCE23_09525 [Candidatus Binatus sp.]|uniref:hypothetical protein n=1 Tax=Candidatus Binatus sp. TaxID=2811406 RepID=UPI003C71AC46